MTSAAGILLAPSQTWSRTITGVGVEVFVRRGELVLRFLTPIPALYRGLLLHPAEDTDPYVFRIDLSDFGLGPFTVVFSRESDTQTKAVHFDVMPVSAYKKTAATNPRLWVEGALVFSTMAILSRRLRRTTDEGPLLRQPWGECLLGIWP